VPHRGPEPVLPGPRDGDPRQTAVLRRPLLPQAARSRPHGALYGGLHPRCHRRRTGYRGRNHPRAGLDVGRKFRGSVV